VRSIKGWFTQKGKICHHYSPSSCSKPVWISFFYWTHKKIFWRMLVTRQLRLLDWPLPNLTCNILVTSSSFILLVDSATHPHFDMFPKRRTSWKSILIPWKQRVLTYTSLVDTQPGNRFWIPVLSVWLLLSDMVWR